MSFDLGDAWDAPDTGKPPCRFCYRTVPCGCGPDACLCDCGRCSDDRPGGGRRVPAGLYVPIPEVTR